MKFLSSLPRPLLSITGILLLCTPFAVDPMLVNGIVTGKLFRLHAVLPFFAGAVLIAAILNKNSSFRLQWADLWITLFVLVYFLTYNRALDPEPEKLLFAGQMFVLWMILRYVLTVYPSLRIVFLCTIVVIGLSEAIRGMEQLYGYTPSRHHLFRLTGTFYNPGPYSGFLAMTLPICLGMILKLKHYDGGLRWEKIRPIYYFLWFCFCGILAVLPAGMSRMAWIAALISCCWVYWMYYIRWEKVKMLWRRHHRICWVVVGAVTILSIIGVVGIYHLKKDSADGRLLMWRMSAHIIKEHPLTGTGLGGFPAAYSEAQAEYFSFDKASSTEKRVAGTPEYAFNEYLHIGTEQGLAGLLLFLGWIGHCFFTGVKRKRVAAAAGVLSLALFSVASYPLQLPTFWIYLIFLTAICVTNQDKRNRCIISYSPLTITMVILFISAIWLSGLGKERKPAYEEWQTARRLYHAQTYASASERYSQLYPSLNHKPDFLFEAAQCLSKTGQYKESNELLLQGIRLSADPMFHYVLAKNKQMRGDYIIAEQLLHHAIDILPERVYPYYLLTKLYADSAFYQPEKLRIAADSVLHKEPKVESTAIREMREEVKILYPH